MTPEATETRIPEGYVYVCDLSAMPARGKKTVTVDDVRVLIVVCDSGIYAVEDRCPQTGRSIARGRILDHTIITPTNGARYDLATGRYLGGGQSWFQSHWLSVWPVIVADKRLYVRPPRA